MTLVRKIAAVLVMILAVVGILICVAGLVGAWAANTPATIAATGVLTAADNYLGQASRTATAAGSTVSDVTRRLSEVEQAAATVSAEQQAGVSARVEALTQPVAGVSALLSAASSGLVGLNSTLESLDRLPGVDMPKPENDFVAVTTGLDAVSARLDALRSSATAATFDGSKVATAAGALSSELQDLQNQVGQLTAGLDQTQSAVQVASARVPGLIDLASIAVTLLSLLFGAGQVALFAAALRWFRKP